MSGVTVRIAIPRVPPAPKLMLSNLFRLNGFARSHLKEITRGRADACIRICEDAALLNGLERCWHPVSLEDRTSISTYPNS